MALKQEFMHTFHNISRIMDCVGCESCKVREASCCLPALLCFGLGPRGHRGARGWEGHHTIIIPHPSPPGVQQSCWDGEHRLPGHSFTSRPPSPPLQRPPLAFPLYDSCGVSWKPLGWARPSRSCSSRRTRRARKSWRRSAGTSSSRWSTRPPSWPRASAASRSGDG